MSYYIHSTGRLREISRLKDENFEQMCLRILIKEGIVKENLISDDYDIPQYYHAFYWSVLIEEELYDKYLVLCDWGGIDRLFEIVGKKEEKIYMKRADVKEIKDGEYIFDIVYDSDMSFTEAIYVDFPRKKQ